MRGLAGTLRERVTIMRQAVDRDALGAATGAWLPLATRRVAIAADGGGETVAGDAASAAARFRMTLRSGIDVMPGDRIEWDGRTLHVRAVIADPAVPDRIALRAEEIR